VNHEFTERQKEWKDAEKRRSERKRKKKEARDKANRALEKQVKSLIPTPDSTPSAEVEIDYSALPDPNTEGAGGQSPDQRGAGTEPPAQAEGEDTRAPSPVGTPPALSVAGTLEQASPPKPQTGPGAVPSGCLARSSGSARAPKSGSKKCKLEAASG
jgi:hypothetical protein